MTHLLRPAAALNAAMLAAAAGLFLLGAPAPALAHGTHYDCQLHDFRPYPHRHVDPGAAVVECPRPAVVGGFSTSAICDALARRRGGDGAIVNGTLSNSTVPISVREDGALRAAALNAACDEALAACEARKFEQGAPGAVCQIIDQRFAQ